MKIIKKINFITLLIITILSMNLSMVNATSAYSAKFNLTSNYSNITVGDEISITFNINSINGFDGIHLIATKKVYDSNIFEYIGCYPQNGWELKGDSTNIVLQRDAGDVTTGTICTLKFKVLKFKDNSTITLSNIDATGNNGDVYFEDNNVNSPSVNIKITEKIEQPIVPEEKLTTSRGSSNYSERTEDSDTTKVTETSKVELQVSTTANNNVTTNNSNLTVDTINSDIPVVNEVKSAVSNMITEEDTTNNSIENNTNTNIVTTVKTNTNTTTNNIVTILIKLLSSGSLISVILSYFIK